MFSRRKEIFPTKDTHCPELHGTQLGGNLAACPLPAQNDLGGFNKYRNTIKNFSEIVSTDSLKIKGFKDFNKNFIKKRDHIATIVAA